MAREDADPGCCPNRRIMERCSKFGEGPCSLDSNVHLHQAPTWPLGPEDVSPKHQLSLWAAHGSQGDI